MPAPCKAGEALRTAWLDAVRHRVQTDLNIRERKADEIEPRLSERTAKKKWFDHCREDVCHTCFLS